MPSYISSPFNHIMEFLVFFFFNDTATTEIYTLSLHDALPISLRAGWVAEVNQALASGAGASRLVRQDRDRKSTRLNSSHQIISYAVFCLKKKKSNKDEQHAERRDHGAPDHGVRPGTPRDDVQP